MPAPPPSPAQLDILTRIYGSAARDLAGLLGSTAFQRGKASVLLAQVEQISARLGRRSDQWVSGQVADHVEAGARAVDRDLDRAGVDLADGSLSLAGDFLRVNTGAVNALTTQMARDLAGANQQLADSGRRIIRRTSQMVLSDPQVSEVIAKGLVSGGSVANIAKALRTRLGEGGRELLDSGRMTEAQLAEVADFAGGYIQAGAKRMSIRRYAWMVADTQLREAVTYATVQRLTEAGEQFEDPDLFDLVQVMGRSGECPVCDELVGNVFSISGRSADYPPLSDVGGGPPFHPRCTHNLAPYMGPRGDKRRRGGQEPTGRRYVTAAEAARDLAQGRSGVNG